MTTLLLLMPGTPMLFQGQEFNASAPFLFFADHKPDLARLVRKGRAEFLSQFRSLALPEMQACLPDPADPATFERCKLDLSERDRHGQAYALHGDLLRLRREDPVFRAQRPRGVDGAVLDGQAFVLRYFGEGGDDRLLLVNLGRDLHFDPAPEPLLAPPAGRRWAVRWSTEDPRYGGCGTAPPDTEENWRIPGEAAVVLAPESPQERTEV
jgi:maltooligosyltrehalose trehalohydrolase